MSLKRTLVVCPGRGSYTKNELGYLTHRAQQVKGGVEILKQLDQFRKKDQLPTLSELDQAPSFKTKLHTKGEHASTLIFACSLMDYLSIDKEQIEVEAILGNSMGWYISLSLSGVLNLEDSYNLIQTMGSMMKESIIGGQVLYPTVDENWISNPSLQASLQETIQTLNKDPEIEIYPSIHLGGYEVLGANKKGVQALLKNLPQHGDYPFQLINHAAFHTPLLQSVSAKAFQALPLHEALTFQKPQTSLVDGFGQLWHPYSCSLDELYQYTLGAQVIETYDFSLSLSVGLKELAPDEVFLLGPGNSLGGIVGQTLVKNQWKQILNKNDFQSHQKNNLFLNSMGLNFRHSS